MRRHLLTIGLIIVGATGCDNVKFDGMDVAVLPPPEAIDRNPEEVVEEEQGPVNVDGPILMAGVRDGARATLTLVGEAHGPAVVPFPDPTFPEDEARLASLTGPGAEWILFSEGVRIGRLFSDAVGQADDVCSGRTTVSGFVELAPGAAAATRLLALPAEFGRDRQYGDYAELQHVYDQRVASLEIAQEAIPRYGAVWPPQGVLDARKHIQAFDLAGAGGPYVAATFVYQDELAVAPPGQGAYALFIIGEDVGGRHQGVYTWYRAVDTEGKGAPRYFDHLDWDGDGSEEILLDVLGSNRRWFAGLARRGDEWVRTFQDACGSGSSGD